MASWVACSARAAERAERLEDTGELRGACISDKGWRYKHTRMHGRGAADVLHVTCKTF